MNSKQAYGVFIFLVGGLLGDPGAAHAGSKVYKTASIWKGGTWCNFSSNDTACVTVSPAGKNYALPTQHTFTATCLYAPCTATITASGTLVNGNQATEAQIVKCVPCPLGACIGLDCETDACISSSLQNTDCVYDFSFDCPGGECATCVPPSVPTLSQWGLIVLLLLGMTVGTVMHTRRRARRMTGTA